MNTEVAAALRVIAEGLEKLSIALEGGATRPQEPSGAIVTAESAPSFDELPLDDYDPDADAPPAEGSLALCPSHRKPYVEGTYGPYCTQRSDDPEWANKRGYCRITPKNAAAWLREHAR